MRLRASSARLGHDENPALPRVGELRALAASLAREAGRVPKPLRVAASLGALFERWRRRRFPPRAQTVERLAHSSGMSRELLDESLDALLAPFTAAALDAFATRLEGRRLGVGAFVMPANVAGAGVHELVAALLAGAAALVKVSSREPFFFPAMLATLSEIAPDIGARVAVAVFGRERPELADAMLDSTDFAVALGDDETISSFDARKTFFGFGSRASGAFVTRQACEQRGEHTALALARDVAMFEQRGCLSPHHVFVECADRAGADGFAGALARALSALAQTLAPARLPFEAASAIRRVRESARWRRLGGRDVALWEGPAMAWTVVMDPQARFQLSPAYRTVTITPVADLGDLDERLAAMHGRLEAFSVAAGTSAEGAANLLARRGVTWICEPGSIQSPPLEWRHGGGAFLDFVSGAAR